MANRSSQLSLKITMQNQTNYCCWLYSRSLEIKKTTSVPFVLSVHPCVHGRLHILCLNVTPSAVADTSVCLSITLDCSKCW